MPTTYDAMDIDWHRHPACGLCNIADGLPLAFVPVKGFLQRYLPALAQKAWRRGRPLAFTAGDFTRPLLAPSEIVRVNSFKSLKRQIEWMAGRLAAKTLGQLFAENEPAVTDLKIAYDPQGAPHLERRPELSLSISHAHEYAVAGLHQHTDTVIGLDLEKHQPLDIAIMLRTAFSAREVRHLDPADHPRFFACWTLKEAYLKYLGRGFRESLKQIEVLGDAHIFDHGEPVAGLAVRVLQPFPAYTLAIVCGPRPPVRPTPAET